MKKGILVVVALCSIVLSGALKAQAVYFSSVNDFAGDGTLNGVTYKKLTSGLLQNNLVNSFAYSHFIDGVTPGSTLDNATLSITFSGVNDENYIATRWLTIPNPELWLVTNESSLLLGSMFSLDTSARFGEWVTKDFQLGGEELASITENNPWELELRIGDHFPNSTLFLDKSVLTGNYTSPVAEPASMMLLGSGLLGLVGFAGKKFGSR